MVVQQQNYACEYCSQTHEDEENAERCEQMHEVQKEAGTLASIREVPKWQVLDDVKRWLKRSQEYADPIFGMKECPRCEKRVHETWMECPGCNLLLHDSDTSGMMACGSCGNTDLQLHRKQGVTKGLAVTCEECNAFVAHGRGLYGIPSADGPGHEWVGDSNE